MTTHQCLHAKRQQLVKELNQVIHQELQFLRTTGLCLGDACETSDFMELLEREETIQCRIDHIDATDCAYS